MTNCILLFGIILEDAKVELIVNLIKNKIYLLNTIYVPIEYLFNKLYFIIVLMSVINRVNSILLKVFVTNKL